MAFMVILPLISVSNVTQIVLLVLKYPLIVLFASKKKKKKKIIKLK
jgi:hypothetical protein